MSITFDGSPVVVSRRNIKNMYLYVRPPDGHIEVRAPRRTSDAQILAFLNAKSDWISRQQERVRRTESRSDAPYETGSPFFLWGMEYELEVRKGGRRSLIFDGGKAILTVLPEEDEKGLESFVREWYRKELKLRIEERLPELESATRLRCTSYGTRWMKTRWGTCNTGTHKIWLNVQLAKKPPVCLDYVIIHELCHTKVANHGPAFKSMMDVRMPQWRTVRKLLNESEYL